MDFFFLHQFPKGDARKSTTEAKKDSSWLPPGKGTADKQERKLPQKKLLVNIPSAVCYHVGIK